MPHGSTTWHDSSHQQLGAAACINVFRAYAQDVMICFEAHGAPHILRKNFAHQGSRQPRDTKHRMNTSTARTSESRFKACTHTSTHRALPMSSFFVPPAGVLIVLCLHDNAGLVGYMCTPMGKGVLPEAATSGTRPKVQLQACKAASALQETSTRPRVERGHAAAPRKRTPSAQNPERKADNRLNRF